jgi:hypothetical protein
VARSRLPLAALLAVLALAGCGSHESGVSAAKARKLVLQPSDLPPGYTSIGGGASNPFTAGSADPTRFGRKGGWFADYRRPPAVTTGALIVQSAADVFGDAKGAARELAADQRRLAANAIPAPGVGEESFASRVMGAGKPAAVVYTLVWHQRNVTSSLVVTGLDGKLRIGQVVALARRAAAHVTAASS